MTNYLQPVRYALILDKDSKDIQYNVQKTNIPGVSASPTEIGIPQVNVPIPGDTIAYDGTLDVTFLIDVSMENYINLFRWIRHNVENGEPRIIDVTIQVFGEQDRLAREIVYYNAFPTSLSLSGEFDVTVTDIDFITADTSFTYTHYDFI